MYYLKNYIINDENFDLDVKANIEKNIHIKKKLINKKTKKHVSYYDNYEKKIYRPITMLVDPYKRINKNINNMILKRKLSNFIDTNNLKIYGGVTGFSYTNSIDEHKDNKFRCALDLTNFFSNIPLIKVYEYFKDEGYDKDVAMILSYLCCYNASPNESEVKMVVPQGFNTSMSVAYLANKKMFLDIHKYLLEKQITYSIYVDDIIISSNRPIAQNIINDLIAIIKRSGYTVNSKVHNGALTPVHNVIKYKRNLKFINENPKTLKRYHDELINLRIKNINEYRMYYIPLIAKYMGTYNNIKSVEKKIIKPYQRKMYDKVKMLHVGYKRNKLTDEIIISNNARLNTSYQLYKKLKLNKKI